MKRYKIDLMGVSETRWTGCGRVRLVSGETIVYSGKVEENADHQYGVAFMITKKLEGALMEWEPISERIIRVRIRSKFRNTSVINVYAPTNEADEEVKNAFYEQLQAVVDNVNARDLLIILGDLNAKVGSNSDGNEGVMGKHGIGEQNENGQLFTEFCNLNDLVIGGTVFLHKRIHKETWHSPDGRTRNQIDHFTISKKWRKTLRDVRAYRGADIGSDHILLIATLKMRIMKRQIDKVSRRKFNVARFKDENVRLRYNAGVERNLGESGFTECNDIDEIWKKAKEAYKKAAEETFGFRKRGDKEWLSEQTWDLVNERRELKKSLLNEKREERKVELKEQYRLADRQVKRSARRDKRMFEEDVMRRAEEAAGKNDMRTVYDCTRKIAGQSQNGNKPIRDRSGKMITDENEQMKVWVEHFKSVLNRDQDESMANLTDEVLHELRIETGKITKQEIKAAIKEMKNHKAGGIDEIPAELFKNSPLISEEVMHKLLSKVWDEEKVPEDWRTGLLVKLPKKGDLTQCGNWRGITLLSTASKIMAKVLQRRIKDPVDRVLRKNQAGFRENRSCTDHIATLRIIIEQSVEWRNKVHLLFIDFEKAFDSANRGVLWRLLRKYGIPEKILKMIRVLYNEFEMKIIHQGMISEGFECNSGVKQGCSLSGTLFLIIIDHIMRESTKRRTGITWKVFEQLEDLEFADDVCLISATRQQLQQKTEKLNEEASKVGLKINKKKTKYMKVNDEAQDKVTVQNEEVDEVEEFLYLGSIIDRNGGTESDVARRINRAFGAFSILNKIWRSNSFSTKNKLRIFNSNVKSVLLYGCETWKLSRFLVGKLQTCVNKCLRRILRIRWPETITNEELWRRTNQEPIEVELKRRRWKWVGHTLRKGHGDVAKEALEWNPAGSRKVGRPRKTWKRTLLEELKEKGKTWEGIKREAANRVRWRGTVEALCSRRSQRD